MMYPRRRKNYFYTVVRGKAFDENRRKFEKPHGRRDTGDASPGANGPKAVKHSVEIQK